MFFTFVLEKISPCYVWALRFSSMYSTQKAIDTLILTAVPDTQSCQKMQQLQFYILLNRCMQLQLAELTAAHPGYETIRSALNGWDNLQNLDNREPIPSAGTRRATTCEFWCKLTSPSSPHHAQIHLHHLFKSVQIEPTCCLQCWVWHRVVDPFCWWRLVQRIKGNLRGQIVQFASQLFRDKDRLLDARQSCERSFYCPCENMQIHAGSLPKCYFDKMQNGVTTPRTLAIN